MLALFLLTVAAAQNIPLTYNNTCATGRATFYDVGSSIGACGFDSVSNFNNYFPILYGFAPNQRFYDSNQCGECFQVVGAPFGAPSTSVTTPPTPLVFMLMDLCPAVGNQQWCSNDKTHFDLRRNAWLSLTNNDANFEPFYFTFQKVACTFNNNARVSIQVVDFIANSYISLRVVYHSIAIQNRLELVMGQSGSTVIKTNPRTSYNEFPLSTNLQFPILVRIFALHTNEVIEVNIGTPTKGSIYASSKQFDITSVSATTTTAPICEKPQIFQHIYLDSLVLYDTVANHRTANDWRIYVYNANYVMGATLDISFTAWGSFQIARKVSIVKQLDVLGIEFDIKAQAGSNPQISFSINGAGGSAGSSSNYMIQPSLSKFDHFVLYFNSSDFSSITEINLLYFQHQQSTAASYSIDNIKWIFPANKIHPVTSTGNPATPTDVTSTSSTIIFTTAFLSLLLLL